LAGDTLIAETGVITFCLIFKEKNENSIVFMKKNHTHSSDIASKIYQNALRKEIKIQNAPSKEEYKVKRSFFMFCSCAW